MNTNDDFNPVHKEFLKNNPNLIYKTMLLLIVDMVKGGDEVGTAVETTLKAMCYAVLDSYDEQKAQLNAKFN